MTNCTICYKKTNNKTECGHHFCAKCLHKWVQAQGGEETTCPMCRKVILVPELKYPGTRSNANKLQVFATLTEMMNKQRDMIDSSEYVVQILEYVWKMRVIFRQYDTFSTIIVEKTNDLEMQYRRENKNPPAILFHIRSHWGV